MSNAFSPSMLLTAVVEPSVGFAALAKSKPSPLGVLFTCSIWLFLLPPVVFYFGASSFGWHIGADEAVHLSSRALLLISICYFVALLFGFFSTTVVSRWMASTYGATTAPGMHFALITVVCIPLGIAGLGQWYPHVFINVVILIPAVIWSMVLLYKGLPVVLNISPQHGMLMASSLVGWLLVAAVSLLGITVGLWTIGLGPFLGV